MAGPVNQKVTNVTKKETVVNEANNVVCKLIRTYPIFNMADHLVNIQLQKVVPSTTIPEAADDSLASNRQVECQLQKFFIILDYNKG